MCASVGGIPLACPLIGMLYDRSCGRPLIYDLAKDKTSVPQMCVIFFRDVQPAYLATCTERQQLQHATSSEGSGSETETRQTLKGLSEALPEGGHWRLATNWSDVTATRTSESTFSCPCVLMHDVLSQCGVAICMSASACQHSSCVVAIV